jgi:hypothetical protein
MATVLSQSDGLLVVREQQSNLPIPKNQGPSAPENLTVVAQIPGESHDAFSLRVLARVKRELTQGRSPRRIVVSLAANAVSAVVESRRRSLEALVEILGLRQEESELTIVAPTNSGAMDRIALFELVEAALRAAPKLNVRLTFANGSGKSDRHPAAAIAHLQAAEA